MAKKYNNGIVSPKGFDMAAPEPSDQRDIVEFYTDLAALNQTYPGIEVKVEEQNYAKYKLLALPSSTLANWELVESGEGQQGPSGPQGDPGADGKSAYELYVDNGGGLTEQDWLASLEGEDGIPGDPGPAGPEGPQGQQGVQGIQGPQGIQGEQGGGVTIQGRDTVINILQKSPTPAGNMWIATDSGTDDDGNIVNPGDGLVSDETKWLTVGPIIGPKGDKGDTGDTGADGAKGDTGSKGDTGDTGPQGIQGETGAKGDTGDTGPQGIQGEEGPKGDTGDQGPQGPPGTVDFATQTEVDGGIIDNKSVSPKTLNESAQLNSKAGLADNNVFTGLNTIESLIRVDALTGGSNGYQIRDSNGEQVMGFFYDTSATRGTISSDERLDIQTQKGIRIFPMVGYQTEVKGDIISDQSIAEIDALGNKSLVTKEWTEDKLGVKANDSDLIAHEQDSNNPHLVTQSQVGLGNVDNTSDADKPISTATQTALDTKIEGVTAGTGIHINGGDPLNPTISATPQTSAGILSRVYFTGDTEVTSEGTFYKTSDVGKGSVASVVQSVTVNDNQSDFFTQDALGEPIPTNTRLYGGLYAGGLTVSVDEDRASNRYNVEVYLTDGDGAPIASGITGEPVGDLGVQVVAIADSGILEFKRDEDRVIDFSVNLTQALPVTAGQRIRYHFSASKVGTAGGVQQMDIKFGSDHNSYVDTPISLLTSDIINDSSAPGATAFDALSGHETRMVSVEAHVIDTNNPHATDKADVGLGNVDNTSDVNKPISSATQTALNDKADDSDLIAHEQASNNPHLVTQSQVGLGNVDNTSDVNKPISTATQSALDDKPGLSGDNTWTGNQFFNGTFNQFSAVSAFGNFSEVNANIILVTSNGNLQFNSSGTSFTISQFNNNILQTTDQGLTFQMPESTWQGIEAESDGKTIASKSWTNVHHVQNSTTGEPVGATPVINMVSLTQAEYDASTPVGGTFYIITDA